MLIIDFLKDAFSFSKLDCFSKCPRRFFYRYVMRKSESTGFLVFGRAVHKGQEVDNLAKIAGQRLAIGNVLDAAVETYKAETTAEGLPQDTDAFAAEHGRQLQVFEESGMREEIRPVPGTVEGAFEITMKIGNPETGELEIPAKISGFVDVVSSGPDGVGRQVVDYKTGAKPVYQRDSEDNLQFALYRMGAAADTSRVVSFVKGGRQKPTAKTTAPAATSPSRRQKLLTWIADTIRAVRRCLKTGDFPRCAPNCFWCSKRSCDFYNLCYPEKDASLPKLIQVETILPVGECPQPEWRKK